MAGCDGKGVLVNYNLPEGNTPKCPKCGGVLKYDPNPTGAVRVYCDCELMRLYP